MIRSVERFEFKYWITDEVAGRVAELLRPHLVPDAHGGELAQRITSLYLENRELEFWHRHVQDAPDRFKLRVRVYGEPPSGPAFFEVKRKVKGVVLKTRAVVSRAEVAPLVDGSWKKLPRLPPDQDRTLQSFLYKLAVHRAVPRVAVSCVRDAYKSPDPEEDTRLTIDRDTVYQPCERADFDALDPRGWVAIDTDREHGANGHRVMLELKFRDYAPAWMQELAIKLSLRRTGYSKFVSAVRYETFERYRAGEHGQAPSRDTFDSDGLPSAPLRPALVP